MIAEERNECAWSYRMAFDMLGVGGQTSESNTRKNKPEMRSITLLLRYICTMVNN